MKWKIENLRPQIASMADITCVLMKKFVWLILWTSGDSSVHVASWYLNVDIKVNLEYLDRGLWKVLLKIKPRYGF